MYFLIAKNKFQQNSTSLSFPKKLKKLFSKKQTTSKTLFIIIFVFIKIVIYFSNALKFYNIKTVKKVIIL